MIPGTIRKEHILQAIEDIKLNGYPSGRASRKFQIEYEGEHFPPKYVVSLANFYANGELLDPSLFNGGLETTSFLERLGFQISEITLAIGKSQKKTSVTATDERKPGRSHDERCPECKIVVEQLLKKIYGDVCVNAKFPVKTDPEEYQNTPYYATLHSIFTKLCDSRGYTNFIGKPLLPPVDFYIPNPGFILEFDESQHFTEQRKITLQMYPNDHRIGFPRKKWTALCDQLHKHDNDPPWRDETRAWYDTLRDYLPEIIGCQPTVRIYSGEQRWCRLNPENPADVKEFAHFIHNKINHPQQVTTNEKTLDQTLSTTFLKFEYLLNQAKIQYLIDCFEKEMDDLPISKFIKESDPDKIPPAKVLHSYFGRMFAVYLNNPIYEGNGKGNVNIGPLLKACNPKSTRLFSELYSVNDSIKNIIKTSDDWYELFCEYYTIKTSIHELYVDAPDHLNDWGYKDLKYLISQSHMESISKKELREVVICLMHLGVNPCQSDPGQYQNIDHLRNLDYPTFMSKRGDWIDYARLVRNEILIKKKNSRIPLRWDTYSLCAFDSGPIFIQKERGLIFPRICEAISSYQEWERESPVHIKFAEILEQHIDFLIGRYYDYFGPGNDTVDYFRHNSSQVTGLSAIREDLDKKYNQIVHE